MAPSQGDIVRTIEINRNISKNFLLQNHLAQWYIFTKFVPNKVPAPGGPRFEPLKHIKKIIKKLFFRTTWLRCLKLDM